jgi:hypothetical protein
MAQEKLLSERFDLLIAVSVSFVASHLRVQIIDESIHTDVAEVHQRVRSLLYF